MKNIRVMMVLVIGFVSFYVLMCVGLYFYQDSIIFFPRKLVDSSPEVVSNKQYEISIKVDDITLHGWLLNSSDKRLIIYFGGNAEEVSSNIDNMKNIDGYSVLLMNYRGYGLNEGTPSQKKLFSDALEIFDYAINVLNIKPENIVLFGRSLGSGIAVYVASKRKVSKLILVTAYDSIRNVAKAHYPMFPVGLLLRHPFDSMLYAKDVSSSALMIMGGQDTIIPNNFTLNLAKSWKRDCKTILIESADHNDIALFTEYWEAITDFLNQE